MYAVKVQINNEPPVVGGAQDLCVLSAILTLTGKLGFNAKPARDDGSVDLSFRLGGLTARGEGQEDEHLVWLEKHELKVGDKLTLEILNSESADPVESGSKAQQRADDERAYYEHCKRAYLEMREKYGDA